jgi:O-antigen/teichoic acid export membrane protein
MRPQTGSARLIKNTLALVVPNLLNPVISLLLVVLISRYLGVGQLGEYSLVLSYLSLFGIFASMGLSVLIVRQASRRPDQAHMLLFNASIFGTASSLVSTLVMNIAVALIGYDKEVLQAAMVCSLSLLISTPINYLEGVFRTFEKSQYIAFTYVMENLLRVGASVLLLWAGWGIVSLFVVTLGCRLLALMLMLFLYRRVLGKMVFHVSGDLLRMFAREAPTFASIAFFSTIYLGTDQIILSKLKGMESVGIYSAADRLLQMAKTLPLAFASALLPLLAREYKAGMKQLQAMTLFAVRYLFLGIAPIVAGTAVLAENMITFIYGHKFSTAGSILQLQIFSLLPMSIAYLLAEVLIVSDNQRVDLKINMGAAVLNVALNFLLITLFAEWGAALAVLLTMVIFCVVQYGYIRKCLFRIAFTRMAVKAVAAAAGMGIITHYLRDWSLFGNILVSAAVYAMLLVVLKALSPEELQLLKSIAAYRFVLKKSDS